MNAPHIHLMLNHLPIIGFLLGTVILFVSLLKKNITAQVVALSIIALSGIASYPTMYSGGASENFFDENKSNYPVDHDLIHEHEESAELAFWPTIGTGIIALISLFGIYKGFSWIKWSSIAVLVLGIISISLLYSASNSGGRIRHPELNTCCDGNKEGSCSHKSDCQNNP